MRKKVKSIKQLTQTECGICCAAMILKYYKSNESLKELQELYDVGRDGTSIIQLRNLFIERGFDSKVIKVNDLSTLSSITSPFIAYWNNKHFVVVDKIRNDKFYINDPAIGERILTKKEFEENFTDYILLMVPTEKYKPQKHRKYNPWRDIIKSILKKKLLVITILVLLILTYLITLKVPNLIQEVVDSALLNNDIGYLWKFILSFSILALIYIILLTFRGIKFISLNVYLSEKLEIYTFKKLLKMPYKFFEVRSAGNLLFSTSAANVVKDIIANGMISGIIDIGIIFILFVYMISKSYRLSFVVLLIFCINIINMIILQPRLKSVTNDELTEKSKSQSIQLESLMSIMSIKIAAIEEEIFKNWELNYKNVINLFVKRMNLSNISNVIVGSIQLFAPVIILLIGINEYYLGKISIGEIIAFQTIASTFFGLSTSIINLYNQLIMANEYLERVSDIWYSNEEVRLGKDLSKEIVGNIELNNISFSYSKNSPPVLQDISLEIKAGTKIAIVGSSGSGKSTLSKLIVDLYKPTKGVIKYDSINLYDYNKKNLSKQIGIVEQDAMLFNKTIYENIVMNNDSIKLDEVKKICEIACIAKEIEEMPMKYNTLISEMGMNLSGGQRQRILLARALINNPKILVLDEATSSLDNINEKRISDYLSKKGCTRIVIAHRLSTIVDADKIYVLSKGKIVEEGTHSTLINQKGVYYELYKNGQN